MVELYPPPRDDIAPLHDNYFEDDAEFEGVIEYLLKWKGYSAAWNSWEPEENLLTCRKLLEKYNRKLLQQRVTEEKVVQHGSRKRRRASSTDEDDLSTYMSHTGPKKVRKFDAPTPENIQKFLEVVKHAQGPPISIVNEVDDEGPPANFTYVDEHIARENVPTPGPGVQTGCDCAGNCSSIYKAGSCSCTSPLDGICAYNRQGKLRIPPGYGIYECNSLCSCGPQCPNRVVQRGRQVRLEIFKTLHKGWGVRAKQYIPKGTFITQYVGEIITTDAAEQRGERYDTIGCTYLFDLDYDTDEPLFTVDACHYGNLSHFFNHSCDPNMTVHPVFIEHSDPRLHRLAFFACKNILSNDELTFDYNVGAENGDEEPETDRDGGQSGLQWPKDGYMESLRDGYPIALRPETMDSPLVLPRHPPHIKPHSKLGRSIMRLCARGTWDDPIVLSDSSPSLSPDPFSSLFGDIELLPARQEPSPKPHTPPPPAAATSLPPTTTTFKRLTKSIQCRCGSGNCRNVVHL